jgi:prepilin-type N-terminal cleavage/methylation domain-containing protein
MHGHEHNLATRRGMTLIEVVIVLALLAGLAGMTLTTVSHLGDDTRAGRTCDHAEAMKRAVVGNGAEAGRFLAEMGRLPVLQEVGEGRLLSELFECPHAAVIGQTATATVGDNYFGDGLTGLPAEAALQCGWYGPYLMTSGGTLYDGFGGDWSVELENDPATWKAPTDLVGADVGERILGVASWGRDGMTGEATWADRDELVDLAPPGARASLTVILMMRDNTEPGRESWKPVASTDSWSVYPSWSAGTTYSEDQVARPAEGTQLFRCLSAGTSGVSEPTWNTDHIGDSTTDGSVEWMMVSNRSSYANRVRVALFVPYVPTLPGPGNGAAVVGLIARNGGAGAAFEVKPDKSADMAPVSATWSAQGSLTYTNLAPGPRKLCACAFVDGGGTVSNTWGSPLLDVVLKPGGNVLAVYLSEELE